MGAIRDRLDGIKGRLGSIDDRFTSIDGQFARIDDRFTRIDDQFAHIDDRFTRMDDQFARTDDRFACMDGRLDNLHHAQLQIFFWIVTVAVLQFRSDENTSVLLSLMRLSYAVFSLKNQLNPDYHLSVPLTT